MKINKSDPILVIVESPNKKKTISDIFKKAGYTNIIVDASVGHIMELADDQNSYMNTGIYVDDNFRLNHRINPEKYKVVDELKRKAASVKYTFVATDPDREGHVIAWSLCYFLQLDENNTFRMITHEITPKAVVRALENPIPFNNAERDSGFARAATDKAIGFTLSKWLKLYVGGRSAGRCQSAGLLILTNRELEIKAFKPETYYDLYLTFVKNEVPFRAKYIGTEQKPVKHLSSMAEVESIVGSCTNKFTIKDIQKKERKENPKPPFDTISFQQEAATKLNLKVKDAQDLAQKLFEGIEIGGQHVGLVTYIRTDATDMSPEFIPELKNYIESTYGENTFKTPKVGKKQETAQEGHEALRCTDPTMTPEKLAQLVKNDLLIKVYRLIWQRTIASAMPPAIISETAYIIENNGQLFNLISNELVDQGYRAVYNYKDDEAKDESGPVKETFKKKEVLSKCSIESERKQTTPPPRYKEATFLKELQKQNIGRPSTTATLISNILSEKRGYCNLDGKEMVPTEHGMLVATTLNRCFPDLIGIDVTRRIEEELDLISQGKLSYVEYMQKFFKNLTESLAKNSEGNIYEDENRICPQCGAKLVIRRNKWKKLFYGCSNYPNCHYLENKN